MKKYIKALLIMLVAGSLLSWPSVPVSAAAARDYSAVFDANYYYGRYGDLQTAIGNDGEKLLAHFISSGMKEGRRGNEEFNVWAYIANYPDLQAAYGDADLTSYYNHYMQSGKAEGRTAAGDVKERVVIATYSTKYKTNRNRATNLELSASRLNGYVIAPGETFSFSDSILSRTEANGYLPAPSFADGEVVTSVGGGICQVSSTLYAALKSYGIPVAERHVHSLEVDYVPKGYDATISEGRKDLKFTNSYAEPLQIRTQATGGKLTITIYKDVK